VDNRDEQMSAATLVGQDKARPSSYDNSNSSP